ncbi:tetraspanin-8-like [Herrania umbratica]|uniref:Tetraspanin-8-like n=1 Tax=Herrania umbratica TaxID=108875 RepID=A0A6J1AFE0_9ROSI|nr:tetraspanin-8-like [Herrania umbratica]
MVRISNTVFTFINIFPFFLGVVSVVASIHFRLHGGSVCLNALQNPLLIIGLVLFAVSLLAFIGSCCSNANSVLAVYSILMTLVILALTGFTLFAVVVTNKGVARRISGLGFSEYRLGDYSGWLRDNFVNHNSWDHTRSCLIDSHVCTTLHSRATFSDFIKQKLSSIQSGCCKPPMYCKFVYKNATFWIMQKSGPDVEDSDCRTWSNDKQKLCYNCKSCKGGVLANIRKEWRLLAILNICILVLVLITFNIGCSIRKNRKADEKNYTAA